MILIETSGPLLQFCIPDAAGLPFAPVAKWDMPCSRRSGEDDLGLLVEA